MAGRQSEIARRAGVGDETLSHILCSQSEIPRLDTIVG
jgi:transcriptional regulator with XRE-family HTH domain